MIIPTERFVFKGVVIGRTLSSYSLSKYYLILAKAELRKDRNLGCIWEWILSAEIDSVSSSTCLMYISICTGQGNSRVIKAEITCSYSTLFWNVSLFLRYSNTSLFDFKSSSAYFWVLETGDFYLSAFYFGLFMAYLVLYASKVTSFDMLGYDVLVLNAVFGVFANVSPCFAFQSPADMFMTPVLPNFLIRNFYLDWNLPSSAFTFVC